ncbi:MAG: hemolysin family protein [Desulfobulbaceae bacterium]|nr:hemolysin family protein [Desulfobulbaceae bacterium]
MFTAISSCIIVPAYAGTANGSALPLVQPATTDVVLLVFYICLALIVSFLCSIAEAVLLSVTPSYIESERRIHPIRAALLKRLKQDNVDQSLAAILTLNTIAHTAGAIGAGAKAAVVFGSAWFGLFSVVMTLLILYFSEIVPKTIGAVYWARLAGPVAYFVRGLIAVLYPLVWVSERLTKVIAHGQTVHIFSREELLAMARIGEQSGHINTKESRIIQNLFRFNVLFTGDIMTPRTVISALPEGQQINDSIEFLTHTQFSRIPLFKEDIDDITGFVLRDDVLLKNSQGQGDEALATLKRNIHVVPNTMPLSMLFDCLLEQRQHIAIVVNEYGGTEGLVTLEDLVETLIGAEITDELDKVEDMRTLARRLWKERAQALGIAVDESVR